MADYKITSNYFYDLPIELQNYIQDMNYIYNLKYIYDIMKPSINQYIDLLAEFNRMVTNMKNSNIPIEKRKKTAFEYLLKQVAKLDGEELERWKDKLDNVFNPKKAEKVKVQVDFTGYEIGQDVIYNTKYRVDDDEYEIYVKCMIKKINKCSITLAKYECNVDYSDYWIAAREQTFGDIKFEWTDKLRDKDYVVVKQVQYIIKSGHRHYEDMIKATYKTVDHGY